GADRAVPEALGRGADTRARQRVRERLHRDAGAVPRNRAGWHDAEPRGHQGPRGARDQGQFPEVSLDDPRVGPPRGPDALPCADEEAERDEGQVGPDRDGRRRAARGGVAATRSLEVQDAVDRRYTGLRRLVARQGSDFAFGTVPPGPAGRGFAMMASRLTSCPERTV